MLSLRTVPPGVADAERRQRSPIRIIMSGAGGATVVDSAVHCFLSRSSYNPLRNYAPFPMFAPEDILYEDNHLLIVNKRCGDLVQPDPSGGDALERQIKEFIRRRDAKPGEVFLGVVHRIDRPVSGAVIFAKTSKALARLNEMIRRGEIKRPIGRLRRAVPIPKRRVVPLYPA